LSFVKHQGIDIKTEDHRSSLASAKVGVEFTYLGEEQVENRNLRELFAFGDVFFGGGGNAPS